MTAEDQGLRVDLFLAKLYPDWPRAQIQRAIEAGQVYLGDSRLQKAGQRLKAGQVLRWRREHLEPKAPEAEALGLSVLYADADIFVIDKPAGLVMHPGAGHREHTLINGLLDLDPKIAEVGAPQRPGLVHRLDADTSGLVLVARSSEAYDRLVAAFAKHAIDRQYLALCHAPRLPLEGRIQTFYGRHPSQRIKYTGRLEASDKVAITHYRCVERNAAGYALIACQLETGRTHQVRVHLSESGAPILGDPLYAPKNVAQTKLVSRLALHAWQLSFKHPLSAQVLCFQSPLSETLQASMAKLGLQPWSGQSPFPAPRF